MVNGNGFPNHDCCGSGAGWCSDNSFDVISGRPKGSGNGSGKSFGSGDNGRGYGKGKLPRRIDYYEVDSL